jgi:orotate phosphoribosyltransferase
MQLPNLPAFSHLVAMSSVKIQSDHALEVASRLLEIGAIRIDYKTPFTWSSGWKSPIYCDNRLALSYPQHRDFIRDCLVAAVRSNFPKAECIAGVATAGIPQGALVADALGLPYVYVRPKPKEHGMGNMIEGKITKGQKAVLIEDLISTGGSSLKAAQAMTEAGFKVIGMAAIFTYAFDTAARNFDEAGIPLVCLSDFNYLLQEAVNRKYLDEKALVYLKSWRSDPAGWK